MAEVTQEQIAASESAVPESAPVETPAEPVATDTTETVAETDEQKNAREIEERRQRSEKQSRGIQRRFDELTAEKHQLARLLEQALGQKQQPATPTPAPADQEPKREQFSDYEDFVAAKAEYRASQKAEKIIAQRLAGTQEEAQKRYVDAEAARLRHTFLTRQREYAKTVPDYDDVVQTEDIRIPPESAAILHTMEDAPAVIYHLAKNPEVTQALQGQPPIRQAMILGQLSAALKGPPQVSKAPAPGKPTGARSGESGQPPSDMEGYMAWRAKQRAK